MRIWITIIVIILSSYLLSAQQTDGVLLQLEPWFKDGPLMLQQDSYMVNGTIVSVNMLRLYLTNIVLLKDGKPVWKEKNSYHLVDAARAQSLTIVLRLPQLLAFDGIQFQMGVDSLTNVSGAMGGDLDPTRGMYWSWQSGYINFKLEGHSPVCNTRNQEFAFHLGGYLPPYTTLQSVELATTHVDSIHVKMDIARFFAGIDLSQKNHIMSPGGAAQTLSQLAATIFYCDEQP